MGRAIVTELLKLNSGPIYLICEDNVVDFFRRIGFDTDTKYRDAGGSALQVGALRREIGYQPRD